MSVYLYKIEQGTAFRVNTWYHNLEYSNADFLSETKAEFEKEYGEETNLDVFALNSGFYINQQVANALANLKDTNGNQVDFNSLDSRQQSYIISFISRPLQATGVFGTRASISDVQIDLSQGFYVQANIHTIDGQVFSSAAKYAPKSAEYVEKYDTAAYVGEYANNKECGKLSDFDRDYKFYFARAGNLSTDERMALLSEVENLNTLDFGNFEGLVDVSCISFYNHNGLATSSEDSLFNTQVANNINGKIGVGIKLDINKASEALKNLPKDEELEFETVTKTFLDNFWDKFKAQIYEATLISKQKQELNHISGNNDNKKEQKPLSPLTSLLSNEEL